MKRPIVLFLLGVLLFSIACGTMQALPTATTEPTATLLPTKVTFIPGDYLGTNPDIKISMDETGLIGMMGIGMHSQEEECGGTIRYILVNSDGTFYGWSTGAIITGTVVGTTMRGQYEFKTCRVGSKENFEFKDLYRKGSWTATLTEPTPTSPPPTPRPTQIPPKLGYYGGDAHFTLSSSCLEGCPIEVTGFQLSVQGKGNVCRFSQNGIWHLDKNNSLTAQDDNEPGTITLWVVGEQALGKFYNTNCGTGDWGAIWFNP